MKYENMRTIFMANRYVITLVPSLQKVHKQSIQTSSHDAHCEHSQMVTGQKWRNHSRKYWLEPDTRLSF